MNRETAWCKKKTRSFFKKNLAAVLSAKFTDREKAMLEFRHVENIVDNNADARIG